MHVGPYGRMHDLLKLAQPNGILKYYGSKLTSIDRAIGTNDLATKSGYNLLVDPRTGLLEPVGYLVGINCTCP